MGEQLVSHKVALLAKRRGFCIITPEYYDKENPLAHVINLKSHGWVSHDSMFTEDNDYPVDAKFSTYQMDAGTVYAPTQGLLQKWLRDVHNIDVWAQPFVATGKDPVTPMYLPDESYCYYLFKDGVFIKDDIDCLDFEEALEKGLIEALKLIKT